MTLDRTELLGIDLGERYVIQRELGRGGMATVYLARDLSHARLVAIKLLRVELAAALGTERFLREIEIASQLQHPNVLGLIDSGSFDSGGVGCPYYIMPYVEGESLRARLERETQLSVEDALRLAGEIASALDYAHRQGVIHRDIKPENVLLQDGHAIVADFGIARAIDVAGTGNLTETGVSLGTPSYMSPEQAAGDRRLDSRADLYALGCVLYEMLAGEPPFTGPTAQAILARHAVAPVPSLRTLRPTVPESVEGAIAKALAKVPADRFATAREFLEALSADSFPVHLPGRRTQGRSLGRRRQWVAAALVLAALAGVTARHLLRAHGAVIVPSASVIAVLPFAPVGRDTALTRLGRDLASTVSANLDGVGEIRTVDRLTVLAQTQEGGAPVSLRDAAAIGRRYGAKSIVSGSLARDGAKVRLDVGLYTSDSLVPLARAVVTASVDSLSALTDSVTWRLLAEVWRHGSPPTPTLEAITTRSVEALRAYLDGERYAVEGRIDEAKASYGRAIAADSTFWFAYFRYANAAGWSEGDVDSTLGNAYRRHRASLPRREQLLIEASTPDSGLIRQRTQLEALVAQYPDYWPAWFQLGDDLVHYYPYIGSDRADARKALERVVALNPGMVYAWGHLLWMYQSDWDTTASARALQALDRLKARPVFVKNEQTDRVLIWRTIQALQTKSPTADSLLDSLHRDVTPSLTAGGEIPFPYMIDLLGSGFPAVQIEFNRRLMRGLPAAETDELLAFNGLAWGARGAWDSVLATADQRVRVGVDSFAGFYAYRYAVLAAWLGALPAAEAIRHRPPADRSVGHADPPIRAELAWVDGMLSVTRQDRTALAAARAALRKTGARSAELDRALGAFDLALKGDRRGAATELAALEWQTADRDPFFGARHHNLMRGVNRLAAADWLLAEGDTAQAARLLTWHEAFSGPFGEKVMLGPLAYLALARIAEGRGQVGLARQHYRQFLRLYDLPVPAHRHMVAEAHAALGRLSGLGTPSGDQ